MRAMFFVLCNESGLDAERTKEQYKKVLGVESFSTITYEQMKKILDHLTKYLKSNNLLKKGQ